MNLKGCFSKNSDDWRTPSHIYHYFVIESKYIDCFPYHAQYDEFLKVYEGKKLFVNPPYSKLKLIPDWIRKQYVNNCHIALLIPARTDTKYFHELLSMNPSIYFLKGRLHFNDSKEGAPFPSIVMIFERGDDSHDWYC